MVHIGFTPDQAGLESFTKQLHGLRNADSSRRLSASIQKSWATVLSAAFGVEMQDEELLSVEQARELTSTLAQRMQSEDFNKQIDTAMVEGPRCRVVPPVDNRCCRPALATIPTSNGLSLLYSHPSN
jgi:hypothetical protein